METIKRSRTGLSLKIFKNLGVTIGVLVVAATILVLTIVAVIINKNQEDGAIAMGSGVTVRIGNTMMFIPESYKYKLEQDDSITVTDDPQIWSANISYKGDIMYGNFENNFDKVVDAYKSNPKIEMLWDSGIITIDDRNYFYIDVVGKEGSLSGSYLYTIMDNDNVFEIIFENPNVDFNHELFNKLTTIVNGMQPIRGIENSFADPTRNRVRIDLAAALASAKEEK
ncbi:MAG: hypothetical protein Q4F58_03305 [Candidatus Saccharibacteria bacterium]|nr:hypothetical protein [Candidatus Saccharibacteria bacterium]